VSRTQRLARTMSLPGPPNSLSFPGLSQKRPTSPMSQPAPWTWSLPRPPSTVSDSGPPLSVSLPPRPLIVSLPSPPLIVSALSVPSILSLPEVPFLLTASATPAKASMQSAASTATVSRDRLRANFPTGRASPSIPTCTAFVPSGDASAAEVTERSVSVRRHLRAAPWSSVDRELHVARLRLQAVRPGDDRRSVAAGLERLLLHLLERLPVAAGVRVHRRQATHPVDRDLHARGLVQAVLEGGLMTRPDGLRLDPEVG